MLADQEANTNASNTKVLNLLVQKAAYNECLFSSYLARAPYYVNSAWVDELFHI